LGASRYQAGYDIHVTVTYNGTPSNPFPVLINTPFVMTTASPVNAGTCTQFGFAEPGYVSVVQHGVADITAATLTPIVLNESLEKQQYLPGAYSEGTPNWGFPAATPWHVSDWKGNKFPDYFAACGNGTPTPRSYNPNGTTAVLNETQKFWIGSLTHFQGVCVQRGIVTLYTDHGTLTNYESPVANKTDCNQGNVIN
jgi:hypothetical protein